MILFLFLQEAGLLRTVCALFESYVMDPREQEGFLLSPPRSSPRDQGREQALRLLAFVVVQGGCGIGGCANWISGLL